MNNDDKKKNNSNLRIRVNILRLSSILSKSNRKIANKIY